MHTYSARLGSNCHGPACSTVPRQCVLRIAAVLACCVCMQTFCPPVVLTSKLVDSQPSSVLCSHYFCVWTLCRVRSGTNAKDVLLVSLWQCTL